MSTIGSDYIKSFQWSAVQSFLSCDWGTSSLRLRLADPVKMDILAEERSGNGIRETFLRWQQTESTDPAKRISFYLAVIANLIKCIEDKLQTSLSGVPVVFSGMASSSVGILELPYQALPFQAGKDELITKSLFIEETFPHPVLLISGLKKEDDVMRGEETQLIGCLQAGGWQGDGLYLFPGTHSKHILVKDDTIIDFSTYMTGEFFQLLSEKSLLSGSVEKDDEASLQSAANLAGFQQGVKDAAGANLLHSAFQVRIQGLFQLLSKKENYFYLSGLLIGTELGAILGKDKSCGNRSSPINDATHLYLCCGDGLKEYYEKALEAIALCKRVHIFPADWVDKAVVRGQHLILTQSTR
ncbi:2-dehydro-3-deoxygalactonokinase [Flavitalea flava]